MGGHIVRMAAGSLEKLAVKGQRRLGGVTSEGRLQQSPVNLKEGHGLLDLLVRGIRQPDPLGRRVGAGAVDELQHELLLFGRVTVAVRGRRECLRSQMGRGESGTLLRPFLEIRARRVEALQEGPPLSQVRQQEKGEDDEKKSCPRGLPASPLLGDDQHEGACYRSGGGKSRGSSTRRPFS